MTTIINSFDSGRAFRWCMRKYASQFTRSNNLCDILAELSNEEEELDLETKTRSNKLKKDRCIEGKMRESREKHSIESMTIKTIKRFR